jgi:hypothetical protein
MEWAGWRQNCCFESARIRKSLAKKKKKSRQRNQNQDLTDGQKFWYQYRGEYILGDQVKKDNC